MRKKTKKTIKKAIIILVVIFAVLAIVSVALATLNKPLNKNDQALITVTIEPGSSTNDIATDLYDAGLIGSITNYKILSKIWRYDGKYMAGTYSLSPSMSPSDMAKVIISGKEDTNTLTIPEGYTIYQTIDAISEAGLGDKDKLTAIVEDNSKFTEFDFLKDSLKGDNRLEGYLMPNTYSIALNSSEEQIITTLLNQFDTVWTDEYDARAKELGYTPFEVLTVASIIEREALLEEDRPKVASVIYNRLKIDMPLQMCSTVQYILGEQKEELSIADTEIESPYNTYINSGLPKGPICSPGKASIEAALYPEDTDYLYFVVSDKLDGSHNFAKDYETFEKYKAEYNKALEEQNN